MSDLTKEEKEAIIDTLKEELVYTLNQMLENPWDYFDFVDTSADDCHTKWGQVGDIVQSVATELFKE